MEIENNANILLLFFPYIFANDTNARTYYVAVCNVMVEK